MKSNYCVYIIIICLIALFMMPKMHVKAKPPLQNPYDECPPNSSDDSIWVLLNGNNGNGPTIVNIPFDTGYDTTDADGPGGPDEATGHINYLAGVLISEVGSAINSSEPNAIVFDNETLYSMAILARNVAYKNCGIEVGPEHVGIDDNIKQLYDPIKAQDFSDVQRYLDAVTAVEGIYLTHEGEVFDAQYRTISNKWTSDYDEDGDGDYPPHQSIYNMPGHYHPNEYSTAGLPQINANHYATGEGHNHRFPVWNFKQILASFFTGISFVGLSVPDEYRFNILYFLGLQNRVMYFRQGKTYHYPLILQNTATNPWTLTPKSICPPTLPEDYAQRTVALGLHWYYLDGTPDVFEGSRTVLCEDDNDTYHNSPLILEPGDEYPSQRNGANYMFAEIYIPPQLSWGQHWLAVDMEFKPPHATQWGSGLQPTMNMNDASWPTQNFLVIVGPFLYPNLSNLNTPTHLPNVWSNNPLLTLNWVAPNDPIGTDHYTYRWLGLTNWIQTTDTELIVTLPEGDNWWFEVYSTANDGEENNIMQLGPFKIDTTPPSVAIMPFKRPFLSTHTFNVNWSLSTDNSQDELYFDIQYKKQLWNENTATTWQPWLSNTTTLSASFTTLDDGRYWFRVKATDKAGNQSQWSEEQLAVVRAYPYLSVMPSKPTVLNWTVLYSDTTPRTGNLWIFNTGSGLITWTITTTPTVYWLTLPAHQGVGDTVIPFTLTNPALSNTAILTGTYTSTLIVTAQAEVRRNPTTLSVKINVIDQFNTIYLPIIFK